MHINVQARFTSKKVRGLRKQTPQNLTPDYFTSFSMVLMHCYHKITIFYTEVDTIEWHLLVNLLNQSLIGIVMLSITSWWIKIWARWPRKKAPKLKPTCDNVCLIYDEVVYVSRGRLFVVRNLTPFMSCAIFFCASYDYMPFCSIGGKWTTYRSMAEETVDRAIELTNLIKQSENPKRWGS